MGTQRIGVLHPGSMGVSLAASAKATGYDVCWASAGRSAATRARADEQGLTDLVSLDAVVAECAGLVSICPPHGAENLAGEVAQRGFRGIYLDANAISPGRARAVADRVTVGGARYVDGGVIGGPAWEQDRTVLHLSGAAAGEAAAWFADGLLATNVLGTEPTAASALKMCYAAYTKGTSALFYAILATAEGLGVREVLVEQWASGSGGLAERARGGAGGTTSRAWRWIDEMQQISQTFEQTGLPGGFHASASEVFRRMADLREVEDPTTDDVLRALLDGGKG